MKLEFTLKRRELPVTLDGKEYVLIELDGKSRDEIMADNFQRLSFTPDGKPLPMLRDVKGIQSKLLAASLRDGSGLYVKADVIEAWPATVVEALYSAAQELSGLTPKAKEDVIKNGSAMSAGTGTP